MVTTAAAGMPRGLPVMGGVLLRTRIAHQKSWLLAPKWNYALLRRCFMYHSVRTLGVHVEETSHTLDGTTMHGVCSMSSRTSSTVLHHRTTRARNLGAIFTRRFRRGSAGASLPQSNKSRSAIACFALCAGDAEPPALDHRLRQGHLKRKAVEESSIP